MENKQMKADYDRIIQAAKGRGMVSEMANMEECAVLVCGLYDRIEHMEEALQRIVNWCDAYPVEMFIPPTQEELKRANKILEEHGISFSAINAHTMRHVVSGIEKIAKDGLND